MTDWYLMFEGVQKIVQESSDFKEGFDKILRFAQAKSKEYNNRAYWQKAAASEMPLSTLKTWAREGFENLPPFDKWSLLLLDCGDAPDIFRMSEIRLSKDTSAEDFTAFGKSSAVLYASDFPETFWDTQLDIKLSYHNVNELQNPLLSWNTINNSGYHGSNGYLLWLSVATLSLRELLADAAFCKRILQGRPQMIVISGFEEIFFYVGSISETGFRV